MAAKLHVFSAIGFEFGTILEQSLRVPVGIIHSSWGGTPIEAWISEDGLKTFPHAKVIPSSDTSQALPKDPASLYCGLDTNLRCSPTAFGGFLWYQGEAPNRNSYARYDSLMNVMITDWRDAGVRAIRLLLRSTGPLWYPDKQDQRGWVEDFPHAKVIPSSDTSQALPKDPM